MNQGETLRVKYYTIVNTVIWYSLTRTEDYFETGKRLNQNLHVNKLVSHDNSSKLIKQLLNWKILDKSDDNHVQNVKAKAYQIHSSHPIHELIALPVTNFKTRLTKKQTEEKKKTSDILCKRIEAIMMEYVRINAVGIRYLRMKYPLLTPALTEYESGGMIVQKLVFKRTHTTG